MYPFNSFVWLLRLTGFMILLPYLSIEARGEVVGDGEGVAGGGGVVAVVIEGEADGGDGRWGGADEVDVGGGGGPVVVEEGGGVGGDSGHAVVGGGGEPSRWLLRHQFLPIPKPSHTFFDLLSSSSTSNPEEAKKMGFQKSKKVEPMAVEIEVADPPRNEDYKRKKKKKKHNEKIESEDGDITDGEEPKKQKSSREKEKKKEKKKRKASDEERSDTICDVGEPVGRRLWQMDRLGRAYFGLVSNWTGSGQRSAQARPAN